MADLSIVIEKSRPKDIELKKAAKKSVEIGYLGEGGEWGHITGHIENQADLMAKLNKIEKLAKAGIVL